MKLAVHGVRKHLGGRTVLDGVGFELEHGALAVTGANGSGKSTLLKIVAGVLVPDGGSVTVDGAAVPSRRALARLGYVPEGADPPDHLTVAELLALVAALRGVPSPAPGECAMRAGELLGQRVGSLSLGQRRRACIAAALVGAPWLLVLDEPENGLDATGIDELVTLLLAHIAGGGAVLLASHDAAFLEMLGAERLTLTRQMG